MKVITEERLIELMSNHDELEKIATWPPEARGFIENLIKECKEPGHFIVNKLRPMSEAQIDDGWFIAYDSNLKACHAQRNDDKYIKAFKDGFIEDWCELDDFVGWIPMPTYKPEED